MEDKSKIVNKSISNRLSVWEESLRRAYEYISSIEKIPGPGVKKSDYIVYKYGTFHKIITRNRALVDAAVIHFMSFFSTGDKGNMIAGNYDKQITKLRYDVIQQSLEKLDWTQEEYELLFKKIKFQRNGLLAHYDGKKGDFKKEAEGLYSRKMVGAHLMPDEINKLKELLLTMVEITFRLAYRSQNNT